MSRSRSRLEKLVRMKAFERFVEKMPPKMPASFAPRWRKRMIDYARTAFVVGWNTGENAAYEGKEGLRDWGVQKGFVKSDLSTKAIRLLPPPPGRP